MARLSVLALVLFLTITILLSSFVSNSEARKFWFVKDSKTSVTHYVDVPSTQDSLFLSALPKGKVPSSTPSKKGHAEIVNEKLIARHLIAVDRSLRSVPSPGIGH